MDVAILRIVLGLVSGAIAALATRSSGYDSGRPMFRNAHPLVFWAFVVLAYMLAVGLTSVGVIELLQ